MAVLGSAALFMNVADLLRGLKSATASVVQVKADNTICTGFFVASDVVLLPAFALPAGWQALPKDALRFVQGHTTWRGAATPEILKADGPAPGEEMSIALVQVRGRKSGRPLSFALEPPVPGRQVTILHYPFGQEECAVSVGRVLPGAGPPWIAYDADTVAGSSGAPVLDEDWKVVALHYRAAMNRNEGLSRSFLVDQLRTSRHWPQLAAEHGFAEISPGMAGADPGRPAADNLTPLLRRAALSPTIRPRSLSPADRAMLKTLVANPESTSWVLPVSERRAIIKAAGSLAALRRHRSRSRHPAEKVIDSIFKGPPYPFNQAGEEELGWWIQVVHWFDEILPDLPSPRELATLLERLRLRSRLERIAGADFDGRDDDLDKLATWFRGGGPIVVSGVGGVGKSALLAKFALDLAGDSLLFWLDFDRADLAPDDAHSILTALADQLRVQTSKTISPPAAEGDNWEEAARRLGADIASAEKGTPLLVLDSFEAAQYSERYQELWPVLEAVTAAAPELRVCATGRADVPDMRLNGRDAKSLALKGLSQPAAERWLRRHRIVKAQVIESVLRIARGIPLILRLAFRYIEAGGKMEDLPRDLPKAVIAGYLYRRILNRVHDAAIHPLASRVLILRRFSEEMLRPVFEGLVELPPGEPADWCAELRREKGLLEGAGELRLRSEVRAATLELLELETPHEVRQVDVNAAQWYAARPALSVEESAELVYHRLRLGDVAGAASAWRDGCGAFLTYAKEELRDEAARSWLSDQLGAGVHSLKDWEFDAARRVQEARARGLQRAVAGILRERPGRSDDSPLAFDDSYELWQAGDVEAAVRVLSRRDAATPADSRCKALLALLAARLGDPARADAYLSAIERGAWPNLADAEGADLAVLAARIRLTIDLDCEAHLIRVYSPEDTEGVPPNSRAVLAPVDVVLPRLAATLRHNKPMLEAVGPEFDAGAADGAQLLDLLYGDRSRGEPYWVEARREKRMRFWQSRSAANKPVFPQPDPRRDLGPMEERLAELSWFRWWLAASQEFLWRAARRFLDPMTLPPASHGVLETMMLLMARLEPLGATIFAIPLERFIKDIPLYRARLELTPDAWAPVISILRAGVSERLSPDLHLPDPEAVFFNPHAELSAAGVAGTDFVTAISLIHYLVGDDPLESLVHQLARAAPAAA